MPSTVKDGSAHRFPAPVPLTSEVVTLRSSMSRCRIRIPRCRSTRPSARPALTIKNRTTRKIREMKFQSKKSPSPAEVRLAEAQAAKAAAEAEMQRHQAIISRLDRQIRAVAHEKFGGEVAGARRRVQPNSALHNATGAQGSRTAAGCFRRRRRRARRLLAAFPANHSRPDDARVCVVTACPLRRQPRSASDRVEIALRTPCPVKSKRPSDALSVPPHFGHGVGLSSPLGKPRQDTAARRKKRLVWVDSRLPRRYFGTV